MTPFQCSHCRQTVLFENSRCEACGSALGYIPAENQLAAFDGSAGDDDDGPGAGWLRLGGSGGRLRPCANRLAYGNCNWMIDCDDDDAELCISCRLTDVIPTLVTNPANLQHWSAIETAKRRLVFTLMQIGLKPQAKTGPDDKKGLAFHLLESLPGEDPVMTGHDDGLITLNIAEADDVHREAARVAMHEPMRTLLGHLRHEVSHYLQQRYVTGTEGEALCREVFGDERADYEQALKAHYKKGAPPDWASRFISEYASSHPWEDWAETCAHYLLVIDAVQTASAWGLRLDGHAPTAPNEADAQLVPLKSLVLDHWLPVAQFLNSMNRSIGLRDSYPFLLPAAVLEKMAAVQDLLARAAAVDPPVAEEVVWEGEGGALSDTGSQTPAA